MAARISPGGKRLASYARDDRLRVFFLDSGKEESFRLRWPLVDVDFLDENHVVLAGNRTQLRNLSGNREQELQIPGPISCTALSPNRSLIARGLSKRQCVEITDLTGQRGVRIIPLDTVAAAIHFIDNRQILVATRENHILVFDAGISGENEPIERIDLTPVLGSTNITAVRISPNAEFFLTLQDDSTVRVWQRFIHEDSLAPVDSWHRWQRRLGYSVDPSGEVVVLSNQDLAKARMVEEAIAEAFSVTKQNLAEDG